MRWLLVLVLLTAGCGTVRDLPVSTVRPTPTATPPRLRGNPPDTIAIGLPAEPASLAAPPTDDGARFVGQLLFDQLVSLDDRLAPRPVLAESVPTLENGGARWIGEGDARQLQTTFKLRAGARWSDGQPVTARDVVFTWQLALNPAFGDAIVTERRYEKVEAPDDATAVFTFFSERSGRAAAIREPARYGFLREQSGPVVDPLYSFGLPGWWIYPTHAVDPLVDNAPRVSPKAADALATGSFARGPVGSGPFRVSGWLAGSGYTLAARPDYPAAAPKVKAIILKAAGVDQLRAGGVDLLVGEPAAMAEGIFGVAVTRGPDTAWEHLDLNLDHEALHEPSVREALGLALDRAALARLVGGVPLGAIPTGDVPSASPVDAVRAGQLLDGAGWPAGPDGVRARAGKRLQLVLLAADAPQRDRVAASIAQQLAQVGVEVRVETRPAAELFDRPAGRLAQRRFDLALYAWVGGPDPLGDLAGWYGSAAVPTRAGAFAGDNFPGLHSPELDRVFVEAAATPNAPRRFELLRQAAPILARARPTLPLFAYQRTLAADARLVGPRPVPGLVGETWNAATWAFR